MKIEFRKAGIEDAEIYFKWSNEDLVRRNSYEQRKISRQEHIDWFKKKLDSPDCFFYFFTADQLPAGQVRIDQSEDEVIIGISIDMHFRGKKLGAQMLEIACNDYFKRHPQANIIAYIKQDNVPSYKIFKEANFTNEEKVVIKGTDSFKLFKTCK